jgi:hypothetical protein
MKVAKWLLKWLLWHLAPGALMARLTPAGQEFSIGICHGDSLMSLGQVRYVHNPVLTWRDVNDVPATFVADPFMCNVNNRWYMFFEVMNGLRHKGEIGLATSEDGVGWKYQRIVLAEPFHLSYPYVFEWQSNYYLVPEASNGGGIRLYTATEFPFRWKCVGKLLSGGVYLDTSIFRYQDRWWIFTAVPDENDSLTLRLYSSSDLLGVWREHPANPIVSDNLHVARPGGRVILVDGKPIRFTQDVFPVYGSKVRAFEVIELTPTTYREKQLGEEPVLEAGDADWNSGGMHHIDPHLLATGTWIACVDGFRK